MRQAKRGLEMQDDPLAEQNLLTIHLLITWSQLLMESSQDALSIILQDSKYGESYSPIEKFFEYLERLDERISVSMRHRQAAKTQGRSKDTHHKEEKKKNNSYSPRSLKWTTKANVQAGCGTFCKTGDRHFPDRCPKLMNGGVTEVLVNKKGLRMCCLRKKKKMLRW